MTQWPSIADEGASYSRGAGLQQLCSVTDLWGCSWHPIYLDQEAATKCASGQCNGPAWASEQRELARVDPNSTPTQEHQLPSEGITHEIRQGKHITLHEANLFLNAHNRQVWVFVPVQIWVFIKSQVFLNSRMHKKIMLHSSKGISHRKVTKDRNKNIIKHDSKKGKSQP